MQVTEGEGPGKGAETDTRDSLRVRSIFPCPAPLFPVECHYDESEAGP